MYEKHPRSKSNFLETGNFLPSGRPDRSVFAACGVFGFFHARGIARIFYFILLKSWDFTTAGIIPWYFAKAGISIHLLSFNDFITMNKQIGGTLVPTTERISKLL